MSAPNGCQIDSPLQLRHIPFKFDNTRPDESALHLIHTLSGEWRDSEGPIVFVRFTEGITNTLTKAVKKRPGLSDVEADKDAILIRAYGNGTDALIDRQRELRSHNLLANLGLAPALLARFDNGLMYRYVEGSVCTPSDLRKPRIYRAVARRLGEWHSVLPISAIATQPKSDSGNASEKEPNWPVPNIWSVMQSWIGALPSTTQKDLDRIATLREELGWLSDKLGHTPGLDGRHYVFGHCDLLSGNVIVQPSQSSGNPAEEVSVSFIDYEYATPSSAAFDIANHFAEWAGFDCDHSAMPTRTERLDFLKHYVGSFRSHSISDDDQTVEIDLHNDVVQLHEQVDLFRGVPGFYWGIWALIQAQISQIDFDYASYAELRFGEYWGWKKEHDGSRARSGEDMTVRERKWAEA